MNIHDTSINYLLSTKNIDITSMKYHIFNINLSYFRILDKCLSLCFNMRLRRYQKMIDQVMRSSWPWWWGRWWAMVQSHCSPRSSQQHWSCWRMWAWRAWHRPRNAPFRWGGVDSHLWGRPWGRSPSRGTSQFLFFPSWSFPRPCSQWSSCRRHRRLPGRGARCWLNKMELTVQNLLAVSVGKVKADVDVSLLEDGGRQLLLEVQLELVPLVSEELIEERVSIHLLMLSWILYGLGIRGFSAEARSRCLLANFFEESVSGEKLLFVGV